MQLHEQYRPSNWTEVVGQEKALVQIEALRPRGFGGRAYWISGQSGTGKTTIAKLLAGEIAEPLCTEEIDATDMTPAKLREIEDNMQTYGWGGKGRAFIINEAHGLRKDAIRQLLVLLERLPSHVVMIFTTTCEGNESLFEDNIDAHPLLSRCQEIPLSRRDLAQAFAERAKQIALAEGLNGMDDSEYLKLVRNCKNNMRAVLQAIEAGVMNNGY
jgi:DNA polymerase-3 subunit gamma/tau